MAMSKDERRAYQKAYMVRRTEEYKDALLKGSVRIEDVPRTYLDRIPLVRLGILAPEKSGRKMGSHYPRIQKQGQHPMAHRDGFCDSCGGLLKSKVYGDSKGPNCNWCMSGRGKVNARDRIAESSNGRTTAFGAVDGGSSPFSAT